MSQFRSLLLAHHAGDSHATQVAVKQFTDNVARRTNGQVTIANVFNSTLGTMPELLRMVMEGTADMALPTNDRFGIYLPKIDCVNLPFMFDDYDHADRVMDGEFSDWILPDLKNLGIVYLGSWEWGFRQFTNSRRPILRPEDMRGLKIRVPLVPQYRESVHAFGGTPVLVEYSQLQGIIKQGLLDGHENPIAVIHALGLHHFYKYLSLLNYSYCTLMHVVNAKSFERLTPEQQIVLREESIKAGQLMRRLVRSQESQQLAFFGDHGMQIDRPDPEPFKAALGPVYRSSCEYIGAENVHVFLSMLERRREAPKRTTP
jgi:tripartite ATP-independent transporter DctP family solute receptor